MGANASPRRSQRGEEEELVASPTPSPSPTPTPTPAPKSPTPFSPSLPPPPKRSFPTTTRFPFSPSPVAVSSAAAAAADASSTDKACVSLFDWWLLGVERECGGKKLAVGGFTTRKQATRIFTSAPIVKRHDAYTLETEDGIIVIIQGMINRERMQSNGFPPEVSKCFLIGFPYNWDQYANEYLQKNPASTNSSGSFFSVSEQHKDSIKGGDFGAKITRNFIDSIKNLFQLTSVDSIVQRSQCLPNEAETHKYKDANKNVDLMPHSVEGNLSAKTIEISEISGMKSVLISSSLNVEDVIPGEQNHSGNLRTDDRNVLDNTSVQKGATIIDAGLLKVRMNVARTLLDSCGSTSRKISTRKAGARTKSQVSSLNREVEPSNLSQENTGSYCVKGESTSLINVEATNSEAPVVEKRSKDEVLSTPRKRKIKQPTSSVIHLEASPVEKKTKEKVLRTTKRTTKTPTSQVYQAPITRQHAKQLSFASPESLNLRRTRSGRIIVPPLAKGSQQIIYDAVCEIFSLL
uniref:SANTA domain-containing protein n=1 Tax=Ananas comosus var. bracteatus TaxID=296719 RepID=A0A6V7NPX7_ANACO|nr:unnamed protein product [Ananas comosus var. bracteatus]